MELLDCALAAPCAEAWGAIWNAIDDANNANNNAEEEEEQEEVGSCATASDWSTLVL